MVRRFKSHLILSVICLAACSVSKETDNKFDYSRVENYFGRWKIEKIEKYQGGMTTQEEANSQLGKEVLLSSNKLFFFNNETDGIRYVYREVSNKVEEGVIPEKTTAFYGFKMERKEIRIVDIFKGEVAYFSFEVLEPNVVVFPYDGWLFIAKKERP